MLSLRTVGVGLVSSATALLIILVIVGPSPPISLDVFFEPAPKMPRFILGDAAYAHFDDAADALWNDPGALLPASGGSALATNMTTGFHYWGHISMFHHLRCLRDIRTQMVRLARGGPTTSVKYAPEDGRPGSSYEALGYCFDYLLQGILCHADTTPNPVASMHDGNKIVDGNALWHQCRDDRILRDWADVSGVPHKDSLVRMGP
ncbi:uncharacterized protein LY79DRAFT_585144 [Colletotrichum navitas]|uniref:Oxidase ustYa n=1 Tax=Colletotrichum navitas TaxID=681940 RepID=A0AAD8PK21_9PEZI|nr:uncharacterized protein LY79DRAFT_585144 [Colletotrichum navitas]KAK1565917.1 hypothetical protein LY79DRAFT_585144 [Colletotrichum navitas]